jgi:hypothetical protein
VLDTLIDAGVVAGAGCDDKPGDPLLCVRPMIVQITSDPSLPAALAPEKTPALPDSAVPFSMRLIPDVLTPLVAFYDTRSGLGERANLVLESRLRQIINQDGVPTGDCPSANGAVSPQVPARCVILRLTDPNIPMSWLLSHTATRRYVDELPLAKAVPPVPVAPTVEMCDNMKSSDGDAPPNANAKSFCLIAAWTVRSIRLGLTPKPAMGNP